MENKKIANGEFLKAAAAYAEAAKQQQRRRRLIGARRLIELIRDKLYEFLKSATEQSDLHKIASSLEAMSATIISSWTKQYKFAMWVLLEPALDSVLDRKEWDDGTHEPHPITKAFKAVLGDAGIGANDYASTRYMSWNTFIDDVLKRIVSGFTDGWNNVGSDIAAAVNKLAEDRGWETRLRAGYDGVEDISDPDDRNGPGLWICQADDGAVWYMSCTGRTIARFVGKWSSADYGVTIWHHQFASWDDNGQLTVDTPAGMRIRLKDFTEARKFNWVTLTM